MALRRSSILLGLLLAATACDSGAPGDAGSGGSPGSGGDSAAGGAPGTGGAPGSGGTTSSGGSPTSSGGAAAGGTTGSGGAPAAAGGAGSGGQSSGSGGAGQAGFALSSPAWEAVDNADCTDAAKATCPLFPQENVHTTLGGSNVSPEMSWPAGPEGTLSFAIVLYDLSSDNVHWALYDIPPETRTVPEGLPAGALEDGSKQAGFSAGAGSYIGSGACGNVYEFRLYALDVATVTVQGQLTAANVRTAIEALRPDGILDETFVHLQSREYCTPTP